MRSGNNFWWSQVQDLHETKPKGSHFKDTELDVFYKLYTRMKEDGMSQQDVIQFFKENFNLGYTAFYTRLRKVGQKYVT